MVTCLFFFRGLLSDSSGNIKKVDLDTFETLYHVQVGEKMIKVRNAVLLPNNKTILAGNSQGSIFLTKVRLQTHRPTDSFVVRLLSTLLTQLVFWPQYLGYPRKALIQVFENWTGVGLNPCSPVFVQFVNFDFLGK